MSQVAAQCPLCVIKENKHDKFLTSSWQVSYNFAGNVVVIDLYFQWRCKTCHRLVTLTKILQVQHRLIFLVHAGPEGVTHEVSSSCEFLSDCLPGAGPGIEKETKNGVYDGTRGSIRRGIHFTYLRKTERGKDWVTDGQEPRYSSHS